MGYVIILIHFVKRLTQLFKMFPRAKSYTCQPYVSRMISFCDSGDTFCDKGNSTAVHGSYLQKYSTQAAEFVEAQVKKLKVPVS